MLYSHSTRHKSWVVYATSFFSPCTLLWKTIKIDDFIGWIDKDEKIYIFMLYLFHWKTFYKHSFLHFSVFGSTQKKKNGQWKAIFNQRKILIKIWLIFYRLFSTKKKKRKKKENNLSLTHCIFYKYYIIL